MEHRAVPRLPSLWLCGMEPENQGFQALCLKLGFLGLSASQFHGRGPGSPGVPSPEATHMVGLPWSHRLWKSGVPCSWSIWLAGKQEGSVRTLSVICQTQYSSIKQVRFDESAFSDKTLFMTSMNQDLQIFPCKAKSPSFAAFNKMLNKQSTNFQYFSLQSICLLPKSMLLMS